MNRTRLLKLAKHSVPPSRGFTALGPAFVLLLLGVSCSKSDTENNNVELDRTALSTIPTGYHKRVCGDAPKGSARCYARIRTTAAGDVQSFSTPSGFGPSSLQSAYLAPTGGAGRTVAIVDAYDDPYAESELATYRSQFGLPACTTANGCFKKVNQSGATSPLPPADSGWAVEIALDLAMVSAICPSCNILLVEANSNSWSDLGTAENAAAALSPSAISNSFGGGESSSSTTYDSQYFNHPGILITVSSGDSGYGVEYPASSKYVLGVGGTSLVTSTSSRGWAETAWNGAGSGCSAYISKPSLQTDPGCSNRTVADVSAVADPNTGVAVYSNYEGGWIIVGGTSASSPIMAAIFTAAGKTTLGSTFPYTHTSAFYDVTSGSNGSCSPAYLCTAQAGFDGPTGWGTPNGQLIAAASDTPQVFSVTFSPSSLEGGSTSTGTILLTTVAPTGGATVALTNSAPSVVTVPSSVVVPAGSLSVTFSATTVHTSTQTTASIQATYPASTSVTGTLTILASPIVASVTLSPTTVLGGATSTATVTLSGAAPTGGAAVALSSSNTAAATVPTTLTIPAGASTGTFTVNTSVQTTTSNVVISAAYHNSTQTATLTVTRIPSLASVTLNPASVDGGGTVTATVTLTDPASGTGTVVSLASSNATVAPVPAAVTVPTGASSTTFTIVTSSVSASTTVTISGTFPATVTQSATLVVSPPGNAAYDSTLMVPRCAAPATFCDTGANLIKGRDNISGGPESNAPNTLNAGCADGSSGSFHFDESLDRLAVSTTDGSLLAAGKTVKIDATVWNYSSADSLDLYFAPNANSPVWTTIATDVKAAGGSQTQQVISTTFVLPAATLPVIRANWRYSGSAGSCTTGSFDDRDDLVFALSNTPVNQPPVVNAGSNQTINLPAAANLSGTVTDDGLPNPPGAVTVLWTMDSGPGTVTFASPTAKATTATFSVAGPYVLRLTANDSALTGSATVTITVNPPTPVNQPPVVSAGSNQTITLPAAANLSGTVTDDGLPNPPGAVTVTWSRDSGPGTVTFANPAAKVTTATFSEAGP